MAEKDMIILSRREANRLHIIHQVLAKKIGQGEGATLIGLSDRHMRRLIKRIREEGDEGICHRSRGKSSNHRISKKVKTRVLELFRKEYADFNLTQATERFADFHGITIHRETLRLWLNEAEIPYKKRKARKHRQRRERKAHFGEMIQLDGSHHDWFEGRGPVCVLMGYIDDATNTVHCRFYDYEGTLPAMDSMKRYVLRYGIPKSVYLDKHSTYKSQAEPTVEEQLTGQRPMSHFEKSMAALGVEVIHANSPQAKGRVERLFKTLQDRLVKEMRLAGIRSIEEANEFLKTFLPKFNQKFRKPAASEANLHKPAPHSRELDRILCMKDERTVRNDFTVAYGGKFYQIEQITRAKKVQVEERLDGTLHITYKGQDLRYREVPVMQVQEASESQIIIQEKKPWIPPADHPWRKPVLSKRRFRERHISTP